MLGNGQHVLGNGPHVLGNGPHVLGNGPHVLGHEKVEYKIQVSLGLGNF